MKEKDNSEIKDSIKSEINEAQEKKKKEEKDNFIPLIF